MSYLIDGLVLVEKALMISFPICCFYLLMLKYVKHEKRDCLWIDFIFITYGVFVLCVTGIIGTSWNFDLSFYSFNLIPFKQEDLKLIIFNIVLFIPMGMFLSFYFKKRKFVKILIIGFSITLIIEFIQLIFIGRLADIDDVIANTTGCMIGYILVLTCQRIYFPTDDYLLSTIVLSIVALLWGVRYKYYCVGDIFLYNLGMTSIVQVSKFHFADIFSMILSLIAIDIAYRNKAEKKHPGLYLAIISFCVALFNFIY